MQAKEVFEQTKDILVDTLGVDDDEVVPEASLIYDLGAESIDFLDISFRIEKSFGIKFPMRQLADVAQIARHARMDTISHMLEHQYRVNLTDEEKELLADLDTQTIMDRISARHRIKIEPHNIEDGIQSVAERIIEYLRDLGFKISPSDSEKKIEVALSDNPTSIQEKVARMLTVQSLVDFIMAAGPMSSRT